MRSDLLFISHGAPTIAIEEDDFTHAVRDFGATLDGTPAMIVVSAHWQSRDLRVNAAERPQPIYDFGGFAPELYTVRYDAPGSPSLAREVASLTGATLEMQRGWDHGVWVPFHHLRPQADIPIVELSLPLDGDRFAIGRALAPLRDRGVVIAASGGVVHNLHLLHFDDKFAPVDDWARNFDAFVANALEHHDFEALANYRTRGPHASLAVPTPEHFEPLLILLGAATERDHVETIYAGFHYGNLSMRTIALRE